MTLFKNGTFILGMGAQKAGTSWLHSYFRNVPDFSLGFQKEYHILDALYVPKFKGRADQTRRLASKILQEGSYNQGKNDRVLKRMAFLSDPSSYFDYFEYLILKSGSGQISCDLTPSHMALPEKNLRYIKEEFEKRQIQVKVIMLMRDPVERCWSSVRMDLRDGRISSENNTQNDETEALRARYSTASHRLRTDYKDAITRIERVFDKDDIIYGFYETMFCEEFVKDLSRRIGFTYIDPNFDIEINKSEKSIEIDTGLQRDIANFYRDTYLFCAEKFGMDFIESIWPSTKFLDTRVS